MSFSSERLIQYLKRSSYRNQARSALEIEVSKLVQEYILDILVLDGTPLLSNPVVVISKGSNTNQQQNTSITVDYHCRNSEGKIDSERFTDAQQLISRKIYVCVFLQEFSCVLFRNNIPK